MWCGSRGIYRPKESLKGETKSTSMDHGDWWSETMPVRRSVDCHWRRNIDQSVQLQHAMKATKRKLRKKFVHRICCRDHAQVSPSRRSPRAFVYARCRQNSGMMDSSLGSPVSTSRSTKFPGWHTACLFSNNSLPVSRQQVTIRCQHLRLRVRRHHSISSRLHLRHLCRRPCRRRLWYPFSYVWVQRWLCSH